jgi:hypothetical protein
MSRSPPLVFRIVEGALAAGAAETASRSRPFRRMPYAEAIRSITDKRTSIRLEIRTSDRLCRVAVRIFREAASTAALCAAS